MTSSPTQPQARALPAPARLHRSLAALGFVLLVAYVAFAVLVYRDLPARIPIHYGLTGHADRYGQRSSWLVLPCLILASIGWLYASSFIVARVLDGAARPKDGGDSSRRFIPVFMCCAGIALTALVATIQLRWYFEQRDARPSVETSLPQRGGDTTRARRP